MIDDFVETSNKSSFRMRLGGLILIIGLVVIFLLPNFRNLSFNVWFGSVATGLSLAFVAVG